MAYIDRENFIAFIDKKIDKSGLGYVIGNQLKDYINKQPTADVVEVVRCEKCKYRTEVIECNHTLYFCRKKQNYIKLNDFCSYGERRTDNDL